MSIDLREMYSGESCEMDWMPFDQEDPLPSDDEPPEDDNKDEPPEDFDKMPEVEPTPPPVEKPKKDKKDTAAKAEEKAWANENRDIDNALSQFDEGREYMTMGNTKLNSKSKAGRGRPAAAASSSKSKKSHVKKEDIEKHMELVLKIDKYRTSQRFADCLSRSRLPLGDAPNMSVEELEELLVRINVIINNKGGAGSSLLGTGIIGTATLIEGVAAKKGFVQLRGWANSMSNDEEFTDLCEQISIDYSILSTLSPEKRLVLLAGKHAMKVYSINNMLLKQQASMQQQQPQQQQPPQCPVMHTQPQAQVNQIEEEPTVEYQRPKRVFQTEGSQVYFARQNGLNDERTL